MIGGESGKGDVCAFRDTEACNGGAGGGGAVDEREGGVEAEGFLADWGWGRASMVLTSVVEVLSFEEGRLA